MSTPQKSFFAVDQETGATYRFNETDWADKMNRFMELHPNADIIEYDTFNPEDTQDTDSIYVTTGNSAYSFSPSEWQEKQGRFAELHPDHQVSRLRGVDYYYNQAQDLENGIREKDEQLKAWQDSREERTGGADWSSVMLQQNGLSPIGTGFDPERDEAIASYVAEGQQLQEERNRLQEAYDNNPRVKAAREEWQKQAEEEFARYKREYIDMQKQQILNDMESDLDAFFASKGRLASADEAFALFNNETDNYLEKEKQERYMAAMQFLDKAEESRAGKLKGFWKGAGSVAEHMLNEASSQKDIATYADIFNVMQKLEKKYGTLKDVSDEQIERTLEPSEKALLKAFFEYSDAISQNSGDKKYKAGQQAGQWVQFAIEFALGGKIADSAAKGLSKGVVTGLERWAAKALQGTFKGVARNALAKAGTMATRGLTNVAIATALRPSTYTHMAQAATAIDKRGHLNPAKEMGLSFLDDAIETVSEKSGELIGKVLGVPLKPVKKWTSKAWDAAFGGTKFAEWGKLLTNGPVADYLKQAGFNGYPIEILEEYVGNAMRLPMDSEALKNMHKDGNGYAMLVGFLPATLIGGGINAAQFGFAQKRAINSASALQEMLLNKGFGQGRSQFLSDYKRDMSPLELGKDMYELKQELEAKGASQDELQMVSDYATAVAEYQTLRGGMKEMQSKEREQVMTELEGQYKRFYKEDENGNKSVDLATDKNGRQYFITSPAEMGEVAAIDKETGAQVFLNESDINISENISLDNYLDGVLQGRRELAQMERMTNERDEQIAKLSELLPKTLNLGTSGTPNEVVVKDKSQRGVTVVDAEGNEAVLSWEQVGRSMGMPINILTDAQIAEAEAAAYGLERAEKKAQRATTQEEANSVQRQGEEIAEQINEATPRPEEKYRDQETGEVDENAFWENDPEGYCQWNDREMQDNGADSMEQIESGIAAIAKRMAELDKMASDDPKARKVIRAEKKALQNRLNRLAALQQAYTQASISEEQRHAEQTLQYRERIDQWRKQYGVPVFVYESEEEVKDKRAINQIRLATTPGWQNSKGVHIYLPHVDSMATLEETLKHETTGHAGFALLDEKSYNELMDKVWAMMSDSARNTFYNYASVASVKDADTRRRKAAEEFASHVAEQVDLGKATAEQKTIWERIVDFFRRLFSDDNLDSNLIANAIRDNHLRLMEKAQQAQQEVDSFKAEAQEQVEKGLVPEEVQSKAKAADGTNNYSTATYHSWVDNLGNEHTGTREEVLTRMQNMGFSEAEIKDMAQRMDTAYAYMEKLRRLTNPDGTVRFDEFNRWAEKTPLYKQIGRDYVKAITSLVSNGDYPVNLEITTDCIKREAFTQLLNELVKRGAELSGMGPGEIVTIQKMMKQYGIEVACNLCFVEGKRLQIINWATQIVNDWNNALVEAGVETDEFFEFGKDGDAFIPSEEWRTHEDKSKVAKVMRNLDDIALLFQGLDPKTFKAQKRKNKKALDKYIKEKAEKVKKPVDQWKPSDEQKREMKRIANEGLYPTYINENMEEYRNAFNAMRNEWLDKNPNADPLSFNPTQKQWDALGKIRNRQIDNVRAKMVRLIMEYPEMRKKMTLNDLLGSKGLMEIRQQHGQAYADLYSIILQRFGTGTPKPVQDAVPYDGEVMTLSESAFKKANEIGGARLFSFSDFDITKVFDYMQMFFDLEANRQMLQSYTKEVAAVLIFGRSNAKFNISTLANAIVPDSVKEEYNKASEEKKQELRHKWAEYAGLEVDAEGNIIGINFSEEHSVSPAFAQQIFHDDSRNKDCGAIMVGASVNHAIFSAAQQWIRMVIPFHLSGMPMAAREKTDVKWYTDNTAYQSTRKKTKDGWSKISSSEDTFKFYNDMNKEGWNMRDKTREYLDWCAEKGFRPKFDWGINSDYYRAYCEENGYTPNHQIIDMMDADTTDGVWNQYYKFLTDFTAYKPVFNEQGEMIDEIPSPQLPVQSNFDFSEMEKDVLFEGERSMLEHREGNIQRTNRHIEILAEQATAYLNGDITEEEMGLRDDVYFENTADAERYLEEVAKKNDTNMYRFIGEKGAANLDKAEEATIRLDNLAVARQMEEAGKDTKAIKLATGWERGVDKLWRYEVPDDFDLSELENRLQESLNDGLSKAWGIVYPSDLGDLTKAYPDFNVDIMVWVGDEFENTGEYSPATEGDETTFGRSASIEVKAKTIADIKDVLVHEIQHAIQEKEGFAEGGSVFGLKDKLSAELDRRVARIKELRAEGRDAEADELMSVSKGLAEAVINNDADTYQNYRNLAGEVEARNVSARLGMSEQERKESLLSETEDVAREDQIVLMDGLGVSEMGANMLKTRITPEQDAAYLKAVEAGDMETAQRMVLEAAKLAMPNTKVVDEDGNPKVVYHQTNAVVYINRETGENWDELDWRARQEWDERDDWDEYWEEQDFNTFSRVNARTTNELDGFFFAPEYDEHHEYGDRTIPAFLNITNPASREDYDIDSSKNNAGREERIRLQNEGYDGVIREENGQIWEYVAFSPSQIKSAEPVTYDDNGNVIPLSERFNEEKDDIRFRTRRADQSAESFCLDCMRDYVRKYGSLTTIKVMSVNEETAKELGYTLAELKKLNGLYLGKKGIAIFAKEDIVDSDNVESTIFHESIHHLVMRYPELIKTGEFFWDAAEKNDALAIVKAHIEDNYKDVSQEERYEEMLCYTMELYAENGGLDALISHMSGQRKQDVEFIVNKTNYGRFNKLAESSEDTSRGEDDKNLNPENGGKGESTSDENREAQEGTGIQEVNIYERFGYNPETEDGERIRRYDSESREISGRTWTNGQGVTVTKGERESDGNLFRTEISPEVRREMDVISAQAIVNGNYMKAPNGKDSKLTPEQWAMVRTKNFLNWAGDWINDPENAAVVLDVETGEPLVLYHGTPRAGFTEFKSGWFTTSKEDAISYSGDRKGRMFDPNEKYEPETLTAGDFRLGYMTFDSEEDRAAFLAEHPTAESAMSKIEYENARIQAEDEEYDALTERKPELQKIWDAYREYERDHFVDTTIGEILNNPDAYTEDDLRRAVLAYDSNAVFDSIDELGTTEERKSALVDSLNYMNEDAKANGTEGILDMVVATRVPRNGKGVKHNDLGNRTYEVYARIERPYEIDANGRGSEFESGDIYQSVKDALADEQYDGVIIRNWRVGRHQQLGDVVVPKYGGNQVKLTSNENPTDSEDIRFKTRTAPAPTKTQDVYKLMRLGADGKLYPLFIGSAEPIELGIWYDAESPNLGDLTKLASGVHLVNNETGEAMTLDEFKAQHPEITIKGKRPNVAAINWATENGARWIEIEDKATAQRRYEGESRSYYNLGINGSGQVGQFAMRPGWHAGSLPTMRQIGKGKDKNLRDDSFVWVKGRIPADVDYQSEADANPDKDIPTHIPTDGFYMKATNANAKASQADKMGWYVAGSFIADEIISDAEARSVIDSWNAEHPDTKVEYDYARESGREYDPARGGLVEKDEILFSTDPAAMDVDELVEKGRQKALNDNTAAADVFMDRIRAINGNLNDLRRAASAQRKYDMGTIQILTSLANELLEQGRLADMTRGEVKRLIGAIASATGKSDLTKSVNRLLDVMIANQLRFGRDRLDKFLRIRGKKVDQRGVEVRGRLDIEGQQIMDAIRDNIGLSLPEIEDRIAIVQDNLMSESETIRRNAENELVGLEFARQYVENIKQSENEEKALRREVKDAEAEYKAGARDRKTYTDFVKATDEAIRENRTQRVMAYEQLIEDLAKKVTKSIQNAGQLREAEKQRVQQIQHFANSDMQGMRADAHKQADNKFWNSGLVRLFTSPLATFEQWLRVFGSKSPDGKGYLYNHFMGMWNKATNQEYLGMKEANAILDAKAREVFGNKVSKWSDIFALEKELSKGKTSTISFWDDGEMKEYEVTPGNLLYIYMVNKMVDGKMKLRKMGISEDDVDAIVRELDPRFITLADWIQDEFLPSLRDKYNAVHERLFGAPMAAIDSYFPIKVLANARVREVDLGTPEASAKPSTITGSIIKRTKNSLALDVLNSDAFDVVLEHVEQMEHWAAFAEFNRDLNTLLSYRKFRNRVQNMSGVLGSGKEAWNSFKETAEIAAGVYQPKTAKADKLLTNAVKGLTAGKISFRMWTAIKQILSMPAFFPYVGALEMVESMATPWKAWNWAMENLLAFEKRWKSREAGNVRLKATEADWKLWQSNAMEIATRMGMTANAFVDAVTCAIGAYAVYNTQLEKYNAEYGYQENQAKEKAKLDATIAFNATQQSSESAFLSAVQSDRTFIAHALTVFRNNSFGMQREMVDSLRNFKKRMKPGFKQESIEFMKKQMVRDGLTEEDAERAANRIYRNAIIKDAARIATFGFLMQFLWNLGGSAIYLLFGDDDEEKDKMIKDAAIRGAFGSIEGLGFGNVITEGMSMAIAGDLKKFHPSLSPAGADIETLWNELLSDPVAGASELVNLLVQAGFGVNPQVLADAVVAIVDACDGDMKTSKEVGIALLRMLQVPQSQVDKLKMDEIDFTKDRGLDLTIGEFAKEYAEYKKQRNAPYTEWLYSDEKEKEVEDKYIKRFIKEAEALKRTRGNEEAKKYYEFLDNEYKEVNETINEMKRKVKEEAQRGNQVGSLEFANQLRDYMESDVFKHYSKYAGYAKAVERLSEQMKKMDLQTRTSLEDAMLETRRIMVQEMERAND